MRRERGEVLGRVSLQMAVVVLLLNDHVLKASGWAPQWSGKLSDVVGPPVAAALLYAVLGPGRRRLAWSVGVVGVAFTSLQLGGPVAWLWRALGLDLVQDPGDVLVALPALGMAWWWWARPPGGARRTLSHRAGWAVVAGCACVATGFSPPRFDRPRGYPIWRMIGTREFAKGCLSSRYWVAKSGKAGLGVMARVTNRCREPRRLVTNEVQLRVASDTHMRSQAESLRGQVDPPLMQTLAPGQVQHLYLTFAFDNEASWNAGQRYGVLRTQYWSDEQATAPSGQAGVVLNHRILMWHSYEGPHRTRGIQDDVSRSYFP